MADEEMTFDEWKTKYDGDIANVADVFFSYERGSDSETCYDELYWILKKAFNAGKKNALKWHDLLKNPDDLPGLEGDYLVALKPHGVMCILSFSMVAGLKVWLEDFVELTEDVIAWCEIPKFEEAL